MKEAAYRPQSDGQMEYDANRHKYTLTPEYVLDDLGIDLDAVLADGNAADRGRNPGIFLHRVSEQIYGAIYKATPFRYSMERWLALTPKRRNTLRDAMAEQVLYILQNGDISAYTGVDAVSFAAIDRQRMEQARIAPGAMDLLISSGIIRLGFDGGHDIVPDYERDGY